MAVINCPECGKEISDTIDRCIHCGYKIDSRIIHNKYKEEVSNCIYWQKDSNDDNKITSHNHQVFYDYGSQSLIVFDGNKEFETVSCKKGDFKVYGYEKENLFLYDYVGNECITVLQILSPLSSKLYFNVIGPEWGTKDVVKFNYDLLNDNQERLFVDYSEIRDSYRYLTNDCTLKIKSNIINCNVYVNEFLAKLVFFKKENGIISTICELDISDLAFNYGKKLNVLDIIRHSTNERIDIIFKNNNNCMFIYEMMRKINRNEEQKSNERQQQEKAIKQTVIELAMKPAIYVTLFFHLFMRFMVLPPNVSILILLIADIVVYIYIYSTAKKYYNKKYNFNTSESSSDGVTSSNNKVIPDGIKYLNSNYVGIIVDKNSFKLYIIQSVGQRPIEVDFKEVIDCSIIENNKTELSPPSLYTTSIFMGNKRGEEIFKETKEVDEYCNMLTVRMMTKDLSGAIKTYDIILINEKTIKSSSTYQDNLNVAQTIDKVIKDIVNGTK